MSDGGPYFTGIMINRQLANPQFLMMEHGSAEQCYDMWAKRLADGSLIGMPEHAATLIDLSAIVADTSGALLREALMTDPALHALWTMAQQEASVT